jgi:hypothetical protein
MERVEYGVKVLKWHTDWEESDAWSPHWEWMMSGIWDKTVCLRNVERGEHENDELGGLICQIDVLELTNL